MHSSVKTPLISLLCALSVPAAWAQAEPDSYAYDGRWKVSMQTGTGKPATADLVLTRFSGTWSDVSPGAGARPKACHGKKLPVTVQNSQARELEFTAWGSSASKACPDISMTVRPVSAKLLEGTLATGEAVTLTRR